MNLTTAIEELEALPLLGPEKAPWPYNCRNGSTLTVPQDWRSGC